MPSVKDGWVMLYVGLSTLANIVLFLAYSQQGIAESEYWNLNPTKPLQQSKKQSKNTVFLLNQNRNSLVEVETNFTAASNDLLEQKNDSITNLAVIGGAEIANDEKLVFMITPTHRRYTQLADLTRLAQTLSNVPNIYWVVVEDSPYLSKRVHHLLSRSTFPWAHLHYSTTQNKVKTDGVKGVAQRMHALEWVKKHFSNISSHAVVYFGDDDNAYDVRLFNYMNKIKAVGVWPVAFCGGLTIERPVVSKDGTRVVGWIAGWNPKREFPVDMAGFAVALDVLIKHYNTTMKYVSALESDFLKRLGYSRADAEPVQGNLKEVLVWHVKTKKPEVVYEEDWAKKHSGQTSYHGWFV